MSEPYTVTEEYPYLVMDSKGSCIIYETDLTAALNWKVRLTEAYHKGVADERNIQEEFVKQKKRDDGPRDSDYDRGYSDCLVDSIEKPCDCLGLSHVNSCPNWVLPY